MTALEPHVQCLSTEYQPNPAASCHFWAAHSVAVTDTSLQVLAGIPVCQKLFSDVSTEPQALLEDRDGHVRATVVEEVMSAFLREQKVRLPVQLVPGVPCAWYVSGFTQHSRLL